MSSHQSGQHLKINTYETNTTNRTCINNNSLYDDDVQRYEADSYKLKYGDRWKRLASSVRDVRQADGTVIREYVIEDPSLLDNLSEDEQQQHLPEVCQKKHNHNIESNILYTDHDAYSSESLYYQNIVQVPCYGHNLGLKNHPQPYKAFASNLNLSDTKLYNKNETVNGNLSSLNRPNNGLSNNSIYQKAKSKSSYNLTDNTKLSSRCFKPIKSNNTQELVDMDKSKYESKIENDEYDKEIESIHEQGEQLKQYGVYVKDLSTKESNECEEATVEYEILDENGNQIFVNNAEDLKSLATSVSEVLQPDGSIIKEYILNDPKIIEQIRNNIKSESFASRDATAPASKNSNQIIQKSYNLMNHYGDQDQHQICAKQQPTRNKIPSQVPPLPHFLNQIKEASKSIHDNNKINSTHTTIKPENKPFIVSPHRSIKAGEEQASDNFKRFISTKSFTAFLHNETKVFEKANDSLLSDVATNTDPPLLSFNQPRRSAQYENVDINPSVQDPTPIFSKYENPMNIIPAASHNYEKSSHLSSVPRYENVRLPHNKANYENLPFLYSSSVPNLIETSNNSPKNKQITSFKKAQEEGDTGNSQHQNKQQKPMSSNQFEVRTKKGKTLKFIITNEDITESDVEECKTMLNSNHQLPSHQSKELSNQQQEINGSDETTSNYLSYKGFEWMRKGASENVKINTKGQEQQNKMTATTSSINPDSTNFPAAKNKPFVPQPLTPSGGYLKRINKGTYTKSTSNLNRTDAQNFGSILASPSLLNKSVDDITCLIPNDTVLRQNGTSITPKMTQTLLLQLLLQQINFNLKESTSPTKKSSTGSYDSSRALNVNQKIIDADLKLMNIKDMSKQRVGEELSDFEDSLPIDSSNQNIGNFKRSNSKKFIHKKMQSLRVPESYEKF